jgi:PilZ domain
LDASFIPRKFEREPVKKIVHLVVRSDGERLGAGAYTVDLSPRGTRVHTALDLIPGQIVEFQPENSGFITRCKVVWRGGRGSGAEDEAGLEFQETFPAPAEA